MFRFFRSPVFAIISGIAALLLLWAFARAAVKDASVRREVRALEREISSLEAEQLKSKELLDYIKTNKFLEEEARVRLGLKKPKEKVIVIADAKKISPTSTMERVGGDKEISNPRKWWRHFFVPR